MVEGTYLGRHTNGVRFRASSIETSTELHAGRLHHLGGEQGAVSPCHPLPRPTPSHDLLVVRSVCLIC